MEMIIAFWDDIRTLLLRSLFSDLSTLCATIRNLGKLMGLSKTQTTEYK